LRFGSTFDIGRRQDIDWHNRGNDDRCGEPMTRMIEVPLDNGESVRIEVTDDSGAIDRVGRGRDALDASAATLQRALAQVRPAAEAVLESMREMPEAADKIAVQFGVKITAEAGAVIARAATEANFSVTVEWKRGAQG
jgi:hypothetical protein